MSSLKVTDGKSLRIGEAFVSFKDGILKVKDPYVSEEFKIFKKDAEIRVRPVPPFRSLKSLTRCLALYLNPKLFIDKSVNVLRLIAPYDLAILVNNKVISNISPFRIKYTVLGTPAEGIICRWFPSEIYKESSQGSEALMTLELGQKFEGIVSGVIIEDVSTIGMKSKALEENLKVSYEVIKAFPVEEYLIVSSKGLLSKLTAAVKSFGTATFLRGP